MDKNLKYKILGIMDLDLFYLIFYTKSKNIYICLHRILHILIFIYRIVRMDG